jgi:hypothetical protein
LVLFLRTRKTSTKILPSQPLPQTLLSHHDAQPDQATRQTLSAYARIPWKDYPTDPECQTESASALLALTETQLETITPKSADRALASTSREQWLAAMNREKQCHCKNGTFGEEWQKADPCPKPIPAGWVFKIKHRGEPIEEKNLQAKQFKARVVIRGQFMKEGF